jgi:hypothetical protein
MKTQLVTAAIAGLLLNTAWAGIKLESRADYRNSTFNEESGSKGYSTTQLTRARLNITHKVQDNLSLKARFDLTADAVSSGSSFTASGSRTAFTEYASMGYSLMENMTFEIGKLKPVGGGMEQQYNGGDRYFDSNLLGSMYPQSGAGGMGLIYSMGDHKVTAQFTNDPNEANPASSGTSRTKAGVEYYGNFMDKNLQVIASYHSLQKQVATDSKPITWTLVGVKYNAGFATFDLDYGMKKDEANGATSADEHNGFVFGASAPVVDSWKAIAKFESSETKVAGTKKFIYSNVGLAVENAIAEGCNFHVAYNMLNRKDDTVASGASDVKENQLLVGIKLYADLVK